MELIRNINQKPPDFMEAIHKFHSKPTGFLLLAGTNGTGKTFSSKAIYNEYFVEDSDFKMILNQSDLNIKWQEQMEKWNSTLYLLNQIVNTKLLVLDDIGTRVPSVAFMDFLYIIADKRHEKKNTCGTIITTNLNAKDMREKFGDAFVSRVASGICVRYDGPDRRFNNF